MFLSGVATAAAASLAGCSGNGSDGSGDGEDPQTAAADDGSPGETSGQSLRMTVGEAVAGSEWTTFAATYPRDRFTVEPAQHEELEIGIDTTGDGSPDETFDESNVSGVNNNDYSFNIALDTGYELAEGDVVVVDYPAVVNPDETGEYDVELTLNEEQTATGTVTIE